MPIIQQYTHWTGLTLTGLSFVYVVLPVAVLLVRLCPVRLRTGLLMAISLGYYLLAQPEGVLFLLASIGLDYGVIRVMDAQDDRPEIRKNCLWFAIGKSLLLTGIGMGVSLRDGTPLLLGALIYNFSGMNAVVEMYRRESPCEKNFFRFALYCCFFPRLYAGPLSSYREFAAQESAPLTGFTPAVEGWGRYIMGAFKTLIIGGQMSAIYGQLQALEGDEITVLSSWLMLFLFALTVYYLLSGFSDMAQGIGLLFGFRLPQNFYYPYQSRNVTDFFERFQMTITAFIRRMLGFRPGEGGKKPAAEVGLWLLSGLLLGLWFGPRLNFLVWGVYVAVFAILERYVYPKVLAAIPILLGRLYALCVVLSSFTILTGETVGESFGTIRNMLALFTGEVPYYNEELLYILRSNWLILIVSGVFATNIVDVVGRFLGKTFPRAAKPIYFAVACGVLGLFTALA
jgi:alginate O-acetyltransferase complex protein AlgI